LRKNRGQNDGITFTIKFIENQLLIVRLAAVPLPGLRAQRAQKVQQWVLLGERAVTLPFSFCCLPGLTGMKTFLNILALLTVALIASSCLSILVRDWLYRASFNRRRTRSDY
jgi:hypothetical protein